MSEASKRNAASSSIVSGTKLVCSVPCYLVGFSVAPSSASTSVRFTDSLGGTKKWEHKVPAEAQAGTGSDVVLFGWPIRFPNALATSVTDNEGDISVCFIPE